MGTRDSTLPAPFWSLPTALGARTSLLLAAACLLLLSACSQPPQFRGTDLGRQPAPDFQLTDQNGSLVSLSSLRGRVVVLTFLYTHCPDVCPLIAEHLREASRQIAAGEPVAFVAISVDPENDTPDSIIAFNQQHGLTGRLVYLNGERAVLERLWAMYYVASEGDAGSPETISHSTRVVLIDKAGNQRINLSSDFEPSDLVTDIRLLLME